MDDIGIEFRFYTEASGGWGKLPWSGEHFVPVHCSFPGQGSLTQFGGSETLNPGNTRGLAT
jgi:hypothetical protein